MPCEHLRKFFQLCQDNELKISSSDVIRITCQKCAEIEVCPDMLTDEYDARQTEPVDSNSQSDS